MEFEIRDNREAAQGRRSCALSGRNTSSSPPAPRAAAALRNVRGSEVGPVAEPEEIGRAEDLVERVAAIDIAKVSRIGSGEHCARGLSATGSGQSWASHRSGPKIS